METQTQQSGNPSPVKGGVGGTGCNLLTVNYLQYFTLQFRAQWATLSAMSLKTKPRNSDKIQKHFLIYSHISFAINKKINLCTWPYSVAVDSVYVSLFLG